MGIMSELLGSVGGPLQYIGETLGKPGAAVRGFMGGDASQLMNLIPFSDTMGLTKVEDRVSGRDLNRKLGLAGSDDNWGNWAGGMVTDILTDPLTYAGGPLLRALKGGASSVMNRGAAAAGTAAQEARLGKYAAQALGEGAGAEAAALEGATRGGMQMPRINPAGTIEMNAAEAGASLPPRQSALADMLGKRRQFDTVVVDPYDQSIAKVLGGGADSSGAWAPATSEAQHARTAGRFLGDLADTPGLMGSYNNETKNIVHALGDVTTNRHETVHGLVDAAIRSGDTSGLPLIAKPAAWVGRGLTPDSPLGRQQALTVLLDEMAAHTLENRGLMNQAKGFSKFMFGNLDDEIYKQAASKPGMWNQTKNLARYYFGNPFEAAQPWRQSYIDFLSQADPAVGRLFDRMRYVPAAAGAAAGAAGLGAGGYGLSQLLNQGE